MKYSFWFAGTTIVPPPVPVAPPVASDETVAAVAGVLQGGGKVAFLLGGHALRERALMAAGRVVEATGAKLFAEVFPTRIERGAGLPQVERVAYLAELASVQLSGYDHLVLVDARSPVSAQGLRLAA